MGCLEGLAALEDPVEVIVVDSASSPPVEPAVEQFRDRIPGLLYRYETEPGLSVARNAGLAAASCELVAFVDDDATPLPDWARRIAAGFDDPAVACVGGTCAPAFEGPRPRWMSDRLLALAGVTSFGSFPRNVTRSVDYPFGANIAFRRDVLAASGGFDPALGRRGALLLSGEESDVVRRLLTAGHAVRLEPAAVVRHTVTVERLESSLLPPTLLLAGRDTRPDGRACETRGRPRPRASGIRGVVGPDPRPLLPLPRRCGDRRPSRRVDGACAMNDLTAIVPVWDAYVSYLPACLEAIRAQHTSRADRGRRQRERGGDPGTGDRRDCRSN